MKKYLTASILIIGFAGSAYAVTGQFGNMCSWGLANHKDVQTDCCVRCGSRARPTASAARTPRANL